MNWHKHTDRQVLIVVSGKGYYQEKGKQPIVIKEGDILKCTANTEHWHSSSKHQDVTYLAIVVSGKGYYQEKGKQPIVIKEGDILKCTANTEHWHSSSKHQDVTYLAIYKGETECIYKGETEWTEVLTQEAYDEIAELLGND